jgi:hypothetical protein
MNIPISYDLQTAKCWLLYSRHNCRYRLIWSIVHDLEQLLFTCLVCVRCICCHPGMLVTDMFGNVSLNRLLLATTRHPNGDAFEQWRWTKTNLSPVTNALSMILTNCVDNEFNAYNDPVTKHCKQVSDTLYLEYIDIPHCNNKHCDIIIAKRVCELKVSCYIMCTQIVKLLLAMCELRALFWP